MSDAPRLLNDDGSASIATAILMSHHALRRDIQRFAAALSQIRNGDLSKVEPLQEEWQRYRATLHGHHDAEDNGLFPHVLCESPELGDVIEQLTADHRRIDPLLERGDRAFAALPGTAEATTVIAELRSLLQAHLATEEETVVPRLRAAKQFPPPPTESELAVFAEGFAWSSQGIAPEVLERVYAMLPESLTSRLPSARAAFDARCERVWGAVKAGATFTAAPDE